MYTLIADCSNFALEHGIYVVDGNGDPVSLMHLPISELADLIAHDNRISSVKLTGATEYCYGLKEEIEKQLALEYANSKRNVEIEVI